MPKKLPVLIILLFSNFFLTSVLFPALTCAAPRLQVEYNVEVAQDVFHVTAVIKGLRDERIFINFPSESSSVALTSETTLSQRIEGLQAFHEGTALPLTITGTEYEIKTKGLKSVTLTYTLNPQAILSHDKLTYIRANNLFIAGDDFLFEIHISPPPTKGRNYFGMWYEKFIALQGLPEGWTVYTNGTILEDGRVVVKGFDTVNIYAGKYQEYMTTLGDREIPIAVDTSLAPHFAPLLAKYSQFVSECYRNFGSLPQYPALLVINKSPDDKIGSHGFAESGVLAAYINPSLLQEKHFPLRLLEIVAHETYHLWMPESVNLVAGSWFFEGITQYQSWRLLRKTGAITEEEFQEFLRTTFAEYARLGIIDTVPLVNTTNSAFTSNVSRSLLYNKGALVAHLLDKKLQAMGQDLDTFLKAFVERYHYRNRKYIGDANGLVEYINQYLGDPSFTKKYYLGTESITIGDLGEADLGLELHREVVFGQERVKIWVDENARVSMEPLLDDFVTVLQRAGEIYGGLPHSEVNFVLTLSKSDSTVVHRMSSSSMGDGSFHLIRCSGFTRAGLEYTSVWALCNLIDLLHSGFFVQGDSLLSDTEVDRKNAAAEDMATVLHTEGLKEYFKWWLLKETGLLSEWKFKQIIGAYWKGYAKSSVGDQNVTVNTMIGWVARSHEVLRDVLISFLFERELASVGAEFGDFVGKIYRQSVQTGRTLTNEEIAAVMTGYLNDSGFTDRYLRDADEVRLSDLGVWNFVFMFVGPVVKAMYVVVFGLVIWGMWRRKLRRR